MIESGSDWEVLGAKISSISLSASSIVAKTLSPGSSIALRFGVAHNIAHNTRYFDINYFDKTYDVFEAQGYDPIRIKAFDSFSNNLDARPLDSNFEDYDVKPSFLINYWGYIIPIIILAICLVTLEMFQKAFKQNTAQKGWGQKLITALQVSAANFLIMNLYGTFDQILLFFILEVKTTKFNSGFAWVSFACALFFLGLAIAYFILNFYIMKKYKAAAAGGRVSDIETAAKATANKEKNGLEKFKENHSQVKVFFEDFKENNSLYFLALFLIRSGLLSVIVCFCVDYPLLEASLYLGVNLVFMVFFMIKRPFKNLFMGTLAHAFCEIIIVMISSLVLALAVMDHVDSEAVGARQVLEKIIAISGIVLCGGGVVFQCFDVLRAIGRFYRSLRGSDRVKIYTTPVQKEVESPDHNVTNISIDQTETFQGRMNMLREIMRILGKCCLPCKIWRRYRLKRRRVFTTPAMDQTFDPNTKGNIRDVSRKDSVTPLYDISGTPTSHNLIGRNRTMSFLAQNGIFLDTEGPINHATVVEKIDDDVEEVEEGLPYAPEIEIFEVPLEIAEGSFGDEEIEEDLPYAPNIEEMEALSARNKD